MSKTKRRIERQSPVSNVPNRSRGTSYIFAIGIDDYQYYPKLANAVRDVRRVVDTLIEHYQFEQNHVELLLDEQATRRNIYHKLDHFTKFIKRQDNLILYYSGHGTYKENINEGYWVPVDGLLDDPGSFIPNGQIISYIRGIGSHHTLILSDACFAGSLFGETRNAALLRVESLPSRRAFTSGQLDSVSDGEPGHNSPFVESLLFHLKNNTKPIVSVSELALLVREEMGDKYPNQTPRYDAIQVPGHRGGEFMFRLRNTQVEDETAIVDEQEREPIQPPVPEPAPPARRPFWGAEIPLAVRRMIVFSAMLFVVIVGLIILDMMHKPSKRPCIIKKLAGEGLVIVQKNDLYGFADSADCARLITAYKFEEAHPFSEGLARVKQNGRYGWMRPDSSTAIALRFLKAGDFRNGRAWVYNDVDSFFINTEGKRLPELKIDKNEINLGILKSNARRDFEFTLTNVGELPATVNPVESTAACRGVSVLQNTERVVAPGASVVFRGHLNAREFNECKLRISSDEPAFDMIIPIKAVIEQPIIKPVCTVRGKRQDDLTGDVEISFRIGNRPYRIIAKAGNSALEFNIPSDAAEKMYEVTFKKGLVNRKDPVFLSCSYEFNIPRL